MEVVEFIRSKIESGEWSYGEKIPSENELSDLFDVSRATLREGVAYLVTRGILRRQRGVGTFVGKKEEISGGLETLISITQWIEKHGYQAGTSGTVLLRRPLSAAEREIFKHWNLSTIGEIRRVRTANEKPVMYCVDMIPDKFMPNNVTDLGNSLFQYLEDQWGQRVTVARSTIEVTVATGEMAESLAVARGAPLLRLRQIHYNQDMEALLLSQDHFVSERFRFDIIRRRS
ncbi:GntR family transcriptional regulator [Alicyclobacillaceae bacterium I2511]|nr:GntR family transcriptional regulator [Alicyclobacillaceae bacterium I2511]